MKKLFTTTDGKHIIEFTSSELVNLLQAHRAIAALCDQFEFTVEPMLAPDMPPPPQIPPAAHVATPFRSGASTRKVKARTVAGGVTGRAAPGYIQVSEMLKQEGPMITADMVKALAKRGITTTTAKLAVMMCTYKKLFKRADGHKYASTAKASAKPSIEKTPPPAPPRQPVTKPTFDRMAAIRAADAKARLKAAGITVPANTFGSDSGIGAPTDEDIEAIRRGKEE